MEEFACADAVYDFLNRFLNFERKLEPTAYRLDRMVALKDLFGAPDETYRAVHVAGSKGKGSTATMIASILSLVDPPVGLYTSPHLLHFTERIAVNGDPVGDGILLPCAEELAAGLQGRAPEDFPGGEAPTYFELLTMLGFLCFRKAGCKRAVIEVGLGGRLDSTNVITPEVCVITPIELEHTELLGDTIPKIASEKAGIIKSGIPVYTSALRPDALRVIRDTAIRMAAPLTVLDEAAEIGDVRISASGTSFTARFMDRRSGPASLDLVTPLIGEVQARNATLAALVALDLGIASDTIAEGLRLGRLRARFEIIPGNPTVVLDGAHTPDSVRACAADFLSIFPLGGILLFGCAKDKDPIAMAGELSGISGDVIVTRPGTFKESDVDAIAEAFAGKGFSVRIEADTQKAILAALDHAAKRNAPLLITGSFYLCAEAARFLEGRNG